MRAGEMSDEEMGRVWQGDKKRVQARRQIRFAGLYVSISALARRIAKLMCGKGGGEGKGVFWVID